jgi:hypothetical protein
MNNKRKMKKKKNKKNKGMHHHFWLIDWDGTSLPFCPGWIWRIVLNLILWISASQVVFAFFLLWVRLSVFLKVFLYFLCMNYLYTLCPSSYWVIDIFLIDLCFIQVRNWLSVVSTKYLSQFVVYLLTLISTLKFSIFI